jgi:Carboxypeptidase regulatory-like domain/TonB dependent receptor
MISLQVVPSAIRRSVTAIAVAALTLVTLARPMAAQTSTSRITGTVRGEDGAPVAGAVVTARSIATNITRSASTSERGFYVVPGLNPDEYEVTVKRLGYAPQARRVRPLIGESITLDFKLTTSSVQLTAVQVSAEAARANADRRTTEIATNIDQEQIRSIPLPERNFLSLALLAPGVRRDGGSITSGAQSANNINVFVDGATFKSDILVGGVVGQDASKGNPFPQNAVQEFRVITQQYKAEYQRATSAIITATTKSGTNTWSGDAFTYFQNKWSIERDYFQQRRCDSLANISATGCAVKPRADRYQIGGSLGGPIIKDKLFLFGSYEGNLQTRANNVIVGAPTNRPPTATLDSLRAFEGTFESPFRSHLGFVKLTYVPGERHRFEGSVNVRDEYDIRSFGGTDSYDNAERFYNNVNTYLLKHQYSKGNALNEVTTSWQSFRWHPVPLFEQKVGVNYSGVLKVGGRSTMQDFDQQRLSLRDDFTYSLNGVGGDHVLKVGANADFLNYKVIRPLNGNPQYTFQATNNWAFPWTASAGFGDPNLGARNQQYGIYAQDDWSPTRRLQVNLGVRWDFESDMVNNDWVTPDSVVNAINAWRGTLACNGTQPFREQLCDPSPYITDGTQRKPFLGAIQPRVGASYDLFDNGKTILFGGYGLYYDRNRYGNTLGERANLQWVTYNFQFSSDGLPRGGQPTTIWNPRYFTREGLQEVLRSGTAPVPELFLTDNDTRPPKAHQFSGGVRQNIGDFEISASYTGVRGYNSFTWFRANRNVNGTCCTQFPTPTSRKYSNVFVSNDDGRNWYDAMFLSVQKRYTDRSKWGWQLSYTLGKAEEEVNAGDVFSTLDILTPDKLVRFDKSTDERHHLTANWIVGLKWGFKLSGILDLGSGTPFNATYGFGTGTNNCTHGNLDCFSGNDWPAGKARNWYRPDGDAFLGMDMWRTRNIDLRLEKSIRTLQGQNVSLTAEVFNVFNYRNFTGFNTNVGNFNNTGGITANPNFGIPTAVLNDLTRMGAQRRAQFGMNYRF